MFELIIRYNIRRLTRSWLFATLWLEKLIAASRLFFISVSRSIFSSMKKSVNFLCKPKLHKTQLIFSSTLPLLLYSPVDTGRWWHSCPTKHFLFDRLNTHKRSTTPFTSRFYLSSFIFKLYHHIKIHRSK